MVLTKVQLNLLLHLYSLQVLERKGPPPFMIGPYHKSHTSQCFNSALKSLYVMPTGGLRFGHCVLREYIRLWIARNTSILYGCTPHTRTQSEIRGREEQRRRARGRSFCDGNKHSHISPPAAPRVGARTLCL